MGNLTDSLLKTTLDCALFCCKALRKQLEHWRNASSVLKPLPACFIIEKSIAKASLFVKHGMDNISLIKSCVTCKTNTNKQQIATQSITKKCVCLPLILQMWNSILPFKKLKITWRSRDEVEFKRAAVRPTSRQQISNQKAQEQNLTPLVRRGSTSKVTTSWDKRHYGCIYRDEELFDLILWVLF